MTAVRRLALAALLAGCMTPAAAGAADLTVGQTRICSSAEGRQFVVTVGRIEPFGSDLTAVSVSLFNLAPGAVVQVLAHLPIEAKALEKSCPSLAAAQAPLAAQFEEGYRQWREAQGGVFSIGIDQIYDVIVQSLGEERPRGPNVHGA